MLGLYLLVPLVAILVAAAWHVIKQLEHISGQLDELVELARDGRRTTG